MKVFLDDLYCNRNNYWRNRNMAILKQFNSSGDMHKIPKKVLAEWMKVFLGDLIFNCFIQEQTPLFYTVFIR